MASNWNTHWKTSSGIATLTGNSACRCKIPCKVGRSATGRAAARYPDHQSLLLPPQLGQSGPIDALRAQNVHVIEFRELFRGERLERAEHHVARVVNDHIQTTVVFDDLRYRRIRRRIR